jgi:hypothetical protein
VCDGTTTKAEEPHKSKKVSGETRKDVGVSLKNMIVQPDTEGNE